METKALFVGSICEILPGYSSETGERSIFDDLTGCQAQVLSIRNDGDVEVFVLNMGEYFINSGRLKRIR